MVDLRKSLLLLVAFAVFASVALAQPTTTTSCVSTVVPPDIRTEGLTEQVGDLYLECNGGTPTAPGDEIPRINIQVFLNARVTSKILASSSQGIYTEALLLFDGPIIGGNTSNAANYTPNQLACVDSSAWDSTINSCRMYAPFLGDVPGGLGGLPPLGLPSQAATYSGFQDDRPNVFQGRLGGAADNTNPALLSATSVGFFGIPFDPPGSTWTRTMRITNVKIDATNRLGAGEIPTQIQMVISISGSQSVSIANPQLTVAYVRRGLAFSTSGNSTFMQCEPPENLCPTFDVRFSELQAAAFKVRNVDGPTTNTAQAVPGQVVYREDTFFNPNFGDDITHRGDLGTAGRSSQGTRLIAKFAKIPAGIDLWVTTTGKNITSVIEPLSAVLMDQTTVDSNGAGPYDASYGSTAIEDDDDLDDDNCDWIEYNIAKLVITTDANGDRNATATWEITGAEPGQLQTIAFGVTVQYTAGTLPEISDQTTVQGHFAPLSTQNVASTSVYPHPRFVQSPASQQGGLFSIERCRTNLLYPFVTNYPARFDTGFAVSNTSMDPFAGNREQEGSCTIYYYGCINDDPDIVLPDPDTTSIIPAGKFVTWSLSGGGSKPEYLIDAVPGFAGYVIVICEFQYAHGYAYISDLGAEDFAQGYVALVMDASLYKFEDGTYNEPLTRTGVRSENLDQ